MESYISKIKNDLFNYVSKLRSEFLANKNQAKYEIKYMMAKEIYEDFVFLNDEKSINEYMNKLINNSNKTSDSYLQLYSNYSKETDSKKKKILLIELNECVARLNAYNECYNIIASYMNKKEDNMDIVISNQIIDLLIKYNNLDKNTTEAKKILEEIYKLRTDREKRYKGLYPSSYRIYVSDLESIENLASTTPKEGFKSYELDAKNFISELRKVINAINEYYFINELQIKKYYKFNNNMSDQNNTNRFYKSFVNYLRKYHVLISSLFGKNKVDFEVDGSKITSNDLLSYLSTCNLDGDFSVYKNKFNNSYIGTETPDKKKYMETLVFLNKCINGLCEVVDKKLNGKKVTLVDKELVFDDIIKMRDNKIKEINLIDRKTDNKGKVL